MNIMLVSVTDERAKIGRSLGRVLRHIFFSLSKPRHYCRRNCCVIIAISCPAAGNSSTLWSAFIEGATEGDITANPFSMLYRGDHDP